LSASTGSYGIFILRKNDVLMHRILIVFAVAGGVLIGVFSAAQRYADNSAIPRYCADTDGVIERVGLILTRKNPVGAGAKRPFIVAAKLIFLVPQHEDETVAAYQTRLHRQMSDLCRRP